MEEMLNVRFVKKYFKIILKKKEKVLEMLQNVIRIKEKDFLGLKIQMIKMDKVMKISVSRFNDVFFGRCGFRFDCGDTINLQNSEIKSYKEF